MLFVTKAGCPNSRSDLLDKRWKGGGKKRGSGQQEEGAEMGTHRPDSLSRTRALKYGEALAD